MNRNTPWRTGRSPWPHWIIIPILTAFSVVLTWPLARKMDDTLVSWGDPVFQMWTIAWNWHALQTDPLDIFNANVFYPWRNVLAYSDHLFGQTLLVLPALALTGNGILADNIVFFLSFILSGVAMYLLVFDVTKNRGAAIIAAVAYTFAPPRLAHVEHLHMLASGCLPLALLCLHRTVFEIDRPRLWWAVGLGATFFAQGLLGIYFFYFMVVMLVLAGAVYLLIAFHQRNVNVIWGLTYGAGACAIAGVLLIPTLLPYLQVNADLGIEREADEVNFWSATRSDYFSAWSNNDLWGSVLSDNFRDIERALFPGIVIVALAAVGVFHRRVGYIRWVLLAVVVGSIALSFGLSGFIFGREVPFPYRIPYDIVPGFRAIRVPARFGHLALVGLGGLAGIGGDLLWRYFRSYLPQARQTLIGAGLVALGLAAIWAETSTSLALPDPLPTESDRADYQYIEENPGPTIELPMGDGPVASAWPNFWSTMHWNQVANGFSGIQPPNYDLLRERSKEFPSEETVRLFQGMGIENVIVHADMQEEQRAELEAALEDNPAVELALPGPDAVYTLEPDPWIWEMAEAVPEGETVDLPDISSDRLTYGMIVAILQRTGHDVVGNGSIDYFELSPSDSPQCYAILDAGADTGEHGYGAGEVIYESAGYALYRNAGCG
ncbi:MAG: hypothetical protein ACOC9Y_07775 [Chloroflexota bacterium]